MRPRGPQAHGALNGTRSARHEPTPFVRLGFGERGTAERAAEIGRRYALRPTLVYRRIREVNMLDVALGWSARSSTRAASSEFVRGVRAGAGRRSRSAGRPRRGSRHSGRSWPGHGTGSRVRIGGTDQAGAPNTGGESRPRRVALRQDRRVSPRGEAHRDLSGPRIFSTRSARVLRAAAADSVRGSPDAQARGDAGRRSKMSVCMQAPNGPSTSDSSPRVTPVP